MIHTINTTIIPGVKAKKGLGYGFFLRRATRRVVFLWRYVVCFVSVFSL